MSYTPLAIIEPLRELPPPWLVLNTLEFYTLSFSSLYPGGNEGRTWLVKFLASPRRPIIETELDIDDRRLSLAWPLDIQRILQQP